MAATLRECFTMARQGSKSSGRPVVIVATTSASEKIPLGVLAAFTEELTIEVKLQVIHRDALHTNFNSF